MRNALLVLLFAFTLSLGENINAQTTSASVNTPEYMLTISAPQKNMKAGSVIVIQIALKNTSDHLMGLSTEIGVDGFMVDVVTIDNATVPDTDRGRMWKSTHGAWATTANLVETIAPGETAKRGLNISDLYDLSHPGKYLVQVRRGEVKSNKIAITVVP